MSVFRPFFLWIAMGLASVSLFAADIAFAQSTGSRMGSRAASIPGGGELTRAEKARLTTAQFAKCVYEKKRKRGLESYLSTLTYSVEADKELDRLLINDCLSVGELTVTDDLMRGAFYEVLYQKGGKIRKLKDFSATPEIDHGNVDPQSDSRIRSGIRFRQFSDCIVRRNPETSRKLLKSRVVSKKEDQHFDNLRADFANCVPAGSRLKFSKPIIRGLIAESLFLLATAEAKRLEELES